MANPLLVNRQTYNPLFTVSEAEAAEYEILDKGIYVGRITKVRYDPVKAYFVVGYTLPDGDTHSEFYHMVKKDGDKANYGIKALSRMLKAAYQIDAIDQFDVDAVKGTIGRFVIFEIVHEEYNEKIYDRIDPFSYQPADGFDAVVYEDEEVSAPEESSEGENTAA